MLDIRKLKELVRLMVSHDLTEIDLRDSEEQVTLRRGGPAGAPVVMTAHAPVVHHAVAPGLAAVQEPPEAEADEGLLSIDSPMVGTFYSASSPDAKPFIAVGSTVGPETVVCLIEAMKIFNEIKAECSGTVERVLVGNGDAVEFGQKLFLVRPA